MTALIMNRLELFRLFEKEGVSPNRYSLHGELLPDRIVLYENYDRWEVFYFDERGKKNILKVCRSEESACEYIHQELLTAMFADSSIYFSQIPKFLLHTMEHIQENGILETAIRVWMDSIIENEKALPENVTTIIFEIKESIELDRYTINFWGVNNFNIINGIANFVVSYIPFHDWISIKGVGKIGFEMKLAQIIEELFSSNNIHYNSFFQGKSLYMVFKGRILGKSLGMVSNYASNT